MTVLSEPAQPTPSSTDLVEGPPEGLGASGTTGGNFGPELDEVLSAARFLTASLSRLDPEQLTGEQCTRAGRALGRVAKACSFAQARLAARAVALGAHRDAGFAGGASFLAAQTGSTQSEAKDALTVAAAAPHMPKAGTALANGDLALGQAAELAKAEALSPGAGEALVELAKRADRATVKDAVRKVLYASVGPDELAACQRRARYFRSWTNDLGMVRLSAALPPIEGQTLISRIEAEVSRFRRQQAAQNTAGAATAEENATNGAATGNGAAATGNGAAGPVQPTTEPFEALAADALARLATADHVGPAGPRVDVSFVVSYEAFRRGHLHEGELCHLVGGCPVPLEDVAQLVHDAFIKGIVTKGKDIFKIRHFGRHIPAELRTALVLGPPPHFDGAKCAAPDCGRTFGLQVDHIVPVSERGPTCYDNLQPLCEPHHWDKTERDRKTASRPWTYNRSRPRSGSSGDQTPVGSHPPQQQHPAPADWASPGVRPAPTPGPEPPSPLF